eukprot:TRINITY_DN8213_c0_g1_i5.p1 TRINITY_DN8213_c0_g1~~TRINITY_DN8213_c0_g1_i5.p1  ORF type:complete len:306 (-),score=51.04 TRINITY_DN8213_c0_g1_i5:175-1092(-)
MWSLCASVLMVTLWVTVDDQSVDGNMLASGGAGAKIVLSDLEGNATKTIETAGQGALLSLDFHPQDTNLLLSSYMDGSHAISNITDGSVVQQFKEHTKFCTKVAWSPCGQLFASCSHDRSIKIYRREDSGEWKVSSTHGFNAVSESMCFGPGALVVAVREDHRLHYIDLETGVVSFQSTCTIEGDSHVWCSVLDLALSPCSKYLLCCTDKSRHIVMPFQGPSKHVRSLYGAINDELSTPRAIWSPEGRHVYSTSMDYSIVMWDVSNQSVLDRLQGHTKTVRCVHHHPTKSLLASGGFDKTVKLWE